VYSYRVEVISVRTTVALDVADVGCSTVPLYSFADNTHACLRPAVVFISSSRQPRAVFMNNELFFSFDVIVLYRICGLAT